MADIRLPNGQVIQNVPDGTTQSQLAARLKAGGYDTSWYKDEEPSYASRVMKEGLPAVSNLAMDAVRAVPLGLTAAIEGIRKDANEGGGIMDRADEAFTGLMGASRDQVGFQGPDVARGSEALQHGIETAVTKIGDFAERAVDRPYIPLAAHLFTDNRLEQDNPALRAGVEGLLNFAPVPGAQAISKIPRVGSQWKARVKSEQEIIALKARQEQLEAELSRTSDADVNAWEQPSPVRDIQPQRPTMYVDTRGNAATAETWSRLEQQHPRVGAQLDLDRLRNPVKIESDTTPAPPVGLDAGLSLADAAPVPLRTPERPGMDFPLRQEVLDTPEVRQIVDSYRLTEQEMIARNASPEELATLRQAFGEYMQKYGVRNAEDATGLRRPLYDSAEASGRNRSTTEMLPLRKDARDFQSSLPIEKTQGLTDRSGRAKDWSERELTPFDMAETPRDVFKGPGKRQAGAINLEAIPFKVLFELAAKLRAKGLKTSWGSPIILGDTSRKQLTEQLKDVLKSHPEHDPFKGPGKKQAGGWNTKTNLIEVGREALTPELEQIKDAYVQRKVYRILSEEGGLDKHGRVEDTARYNQLLDQFADDPVTHSEAMAMAARAHSGLDASPSVERSFDPDKGPGRYQRGGVDLTRSNKKEQSAYNKFKDEVNRITGPTPDHIVKAMWEEKQAGKPKLEVEYNVAATDAMKGIPGLDNAIVKYTATMKPLEEVAGAIAESGDLPGNILAKIGIETLSGSQGVTKVFDNPLVNWGTARIRRAVQEHDKLATGVLYNKENGLVHTYKDLSKAEKAEWLRTAIAQEGKPGSVRFENPKLQAFHDNLRTTMDKLWEYGNTVRELQGLKPIPKRENYLPAKFLGEFYTVVKNGEGDIIGWYSGNSRKEVESFRRQIASKNPEWDVSKVNEKSTGYHPQGSAHAYGVYHQLQSVLEAGSPEARLLSDVVDKYKQNIAKRTAGFYQHQKFKRGIEGSSGRNEFRSELKNADEMMQTIQLYTHQLFEYGEMAKINKDITKLLDTEQFPNKENAQKYVEWYYNQARGINSAFSNALNDMINAVAHSVGLSGSTLRGAGNLGRSYLMWNMLSFHNTRFLMAQLLQPNQFIMQHIVKMKADGIDIKPAEVMQAWMEGTKAEFGLNKKAQADLKWAEENRVIDQSVLEDINSRLITKDVNAYALLFGNQSIRWTEALARRQVFITYMNLLRDKFTPDQARQIAKEWTEFSMTDYRPVEMPKIYKDLGPLGSVMSPLARFKHNMFTQLASFLADWARDKYNPMALAAFTTAIAIQQMYSGLLGLPGREDLDMVWGLLKKFGVADNNLTEMVLKSKQPDYISHGMVSSITGADMSATLGASKALPSEHSMMPLMSKGLAIIEAAIDALDKRTGSSFHNLAKEVLPTSGVVQAPLEWMNRQGTVVSDPKHRGRGDLRRPDDITSKEWLYRFGTLRSVEESKEKMGNYERQKNEKRIMELKAKLMERSFDDWTAGKSIAKHYSEAAKYSMTPQELVEGLKRMQKERSTTVREREGGLPPRSPNQIRKFEEVQRYR